MLRSGCIYILLFSWQLVSSQSLNDNCENATDITQKIFHYAEFPESCNSIIGTLHNQHSLVSDSIDNLTVDAPIYSSQVCIGYKPETTDHYPDLWYKSTFHEGSTSFAQSLFLYAGDTVQVAIYYGKCGALFQSQCFTLTYADSVYRQGAWIIYYPYNVDDNIYIQLKVPPQYNDRIELCFSDDIFVPGVGFAYPFTYETPAGTTNTTLLQAVTLDVHISILPNPANTRITIQTEDDILTYSIYDLHGSVLQTGKSKNNIESLSVSDLPPGMYVISVRTKTGVGFNKFFKQ